MATFTVMLSNAAFAIADSPKGMQADLSFMLLEDDSPQANLQLQVEAETESPEELISQGKAQLASMLTQWSQSLSSNKKRS